MPRSPALLLVALALPACGKDADTADPSFAWSGGDFDFQTLAVDDQCLDGALEALFMPEGVQTPHDFEFPIYVPGYEELPLSYEVDFREPFVGMPVTVTAVREGTFSFGGSVMEAVRLSAGTTYGDCEVTMTVDATFTPKSTDEGDGVARIAVSDPRGDDDRCPVLGSDPCTVTLTLFATRS